LKKLTKYFIIFFVISCQSPPSPKPISVKPEPLPIKTEELESCIFELTNPPPLLIGMTEPVIPPYSSFCISVNYRPDIGAYEYIPPFTPWIKGDFSLNNKVTTYDDYLFNLCAKGPSVPYPKELTRVADGAKHPVACWRGDLDEDEDVDQDDFGMFQITLETTYLWGDANRDGVVNQDDISFVQDCITNNPYPNSNNVCVQADLNESLSVNENDLEFVVQVLNN